MAECSGYCSLHRYTSWPTGVTVFIILKYRISVFSFYYGRNWWWGGIILGKKKLEIISVHFKNTCFVFGYKQMVKQTEFIYYETEHSSTSVFIL